MLKTIYKKIQRRRNFHAFKRQNIYIHPLSHLGKCTAIGYGTNINGPVYITSSKKAPVTIGKYCAIAYNLRIRPRNHYMGYANLQDEFQNRYKLPSLDSIKDSVKVGNNVWIGDNVIILSGVKIGDGSVIGAGSIVTKNVPSYSIVTGNPAKVIKKRFSENIISQLIEIKWWGWPEDKLIRNKLFFETDFSKTPNAKIKEMIIQ